MSEAPEETCDHYADHVHVQTHEIIEGDGEDECSWCETTELAGGKVLIKSQRHPLILCEECRTLIRALASPNDTIGDSNE